MVPVQDIKLTLADSATSNTNAYIRANVSLVASVCKIITAVTCKPD